jgi:hypothetical protein
MILSFCSDNLASPDVVFRSRVAGLPKRLGASLVFPDRCAYRGRQFTVFSLQFFKFLISNFEFTIRILE